MKQVPNIFTLFNLFFGCLAIVAILQNGINIQYTEEGGQLVALSEKMWLGSLFICIAAVIDFLDGFVARLFNATSEMGKQLDSLADVVSFGVAPAMIVFQFLRLAFAKDEDGLNINFIWLTPAFFIAMAAAYRLARFNLDTTQTTGFKGLPVPANGFLLASLPLIYWTLDSANIIGLLTNKWFLYALIVLMCWLMVSKIPLLAFKFKSRSLKDNFAPAILIAVAVISFLLLQWLAIPVTFLAYIILSLIFKPQPQS